MKNKTWTLPSRGLQSSMKKINKHLDSHNIKEKVMCHKKESVNVLWKSLTLVDTFLKKFLYCRVYIANKNKKKDQ